MELSSETVELVMKYSPLPKQSSFHFAEQKYRGLIGGLGSGKTIAGAAECIRMAMEYPGSHGLVVSPTYQMLENPTRQTIMDLCPPGLIQSYEAGKRKLNFINGSDIIFRSGDDPRKLRGPNISWIWGDEAAMYEPLVWDILIGRLRLAPARAWITTTPDGFNWVWQKFVEQGSDRYKVIHASSTENPYLPEDYVASLIESYGETFAQQEVHGQFVAAEGLVYRNFDRETMIQFDPFKKENFSNVVIGCDFGFTNPAALVVVGFDSDKNPRVLEEFYQRRVPMETLIQQAKVLREKWGASRIYADPSEPMFIDMLNQAGLPTIQAKNEVMAGINAVDSCMRKDAQGKMRFLVHSSCVNLIREMGQYRYPKDRSGNAQRDNPVKANDHACDALRYAIHSSAVYNTEAYVLSGSL